jgi:nitroreductase
MREILEHDVAVLDAIFQRRSVRKYSSRPVEKDVIDQLLAAAVQAPSAMNQQPWAFGVFHGHERLRYYSERAKQHLVATYPASFELHSRTEKYENPSYDLFHGADTLIVVYAKMGRLNPNEDCCLAAQNLMLAAHAFGLGTCAVGFARPWFDLADTKRELDVPEHYSAVFPMAVGYPAGATAPPPRDEPHVVSWKWDAG